MSWILCVMNTVCTLKAESSLEEDFQESPLLFFSLLFSFFLLLLIFFSFFFLSEALGESEEVLSKASIFLISDHLILSLHRDARLAALLWAIIDPVKCSGEIRHCSADIQCTSGFFSTRWKAEFALVLLAGPSCLLPLRTQMWSKTVTIPTHLWSGLL